MNIYVTVILYILAVFILRFVYMVLYQYFYWKIQKLPHVKPVPLLGNTIDFVVGEVSAPEFVTGLYNEFEKVSYYGLFDAFEPIILIKDPDLIRQVCEENFENFMDCTRDVIKDPAVSHNLIVLNGQRWQRMRRRLSPIYNLTNRRDFFDKIRVSAEKFVQYLSRHSEEANNFDVQEVFKRFISNITIRVIFGMEDDTLNQPAEFYIHSLIAQNSQSPLKFFMMSTFPRIMQLFGITYLPKTTDRYFRNLIKENIHTAIKSSIVHSLLESRYNQDDIEMTEDDIISQALFIITKNIGVTLSLMSFTCLELARHQNIQDRLYQELMEYFPGENEAITYERLTEMRYLDMVIKESLRLYSPLTYTTRVCVKDSIFPLPMIGCSEYHVKKGTFLMIPIIGLHRDPKYHPEPEKFNPERFSDENSIKPYTYMPFGLGPRKCLGECLAIMETKIVISHILQRFVIRCTEDTQNPVIFRCGTNFTASRDGIKLTFEMR